MYLQLCIHRPPKNPLAPFFWQHFWNGARLQSKNKFILLWPRDKVSTLCIMLKYNVNGIGIGTSLTLDWPLGQRTIEINWRQNWLLDLSHEERESLPRRVCNVITHKLVQRLTRFSFLNFWGISAFINIILSLWFVYFGVHHQHESKI